jgi:Tat protein translocase TatB subunit
MINIGPGEVLAILVIALIVLGPEKLPEMLRTIGRVTSELRRISSGFQTELQNALDDETTHEEPRTIKRTARTPPPRRNGAGGTTRDASESPSGTQHAGASGDSPEDDANPDASG